MENKKEIIELLKSGDFTLVYTDSGVCSLYKGQFDIDDVENWEEKEEVAEFYDRYGYTPDIVEMLVDVLGGTVQSY